jgi:hypothetical protein
MKARIHLVCLPNPDVGREQCIEGTLKGLHRQSRPGAEVRHLLKGVDPCIGPARGDHSAALLGDPLDTILENLLYGEDLRLDLPAVVSASIVLQDQPDVALGTHSMLDMEASRVPAPFPWIKKYHRSEPPATRAEARPWTRRAILLIMLEPGLR